jgi:hypothetical protein
MTVFTLQPYVSALPVTFDMEPDEVETVLGSPDRVYESRLLHERNEQRGCLFVRYDSNDHKVAEITFAPGAMLYLNNVNLFEIEDPIAYMLELFTVGTHRRCSERKGGMRLCVL